MNELPSNPDVEKAAIADKIEKLKPLIPLAVARLDLMLASPTLVERHKDRIKSTCRLTKKTEAETEQALEGSVGYRERLEARRAFFVDVDNGVYPDNWDEIPSWEQMLPYLEILRDATSKAAWALGELINQKGGDKKVRKLIEEGLVSHRPSDISDEEYHRIVDGVADKVIEGLKSK